MRKNTSHLESGAIQLDMKDTPRYAMHVDSFEAALAASKFGSSLVARQSHTSNRFFYQGHAKTWLLSKPFWDCILG